MSTENISGIEDANGKTEALTPFRAPEVLAPVRRFYQMGITEALSTQAPTAIRSQATQMCLLRDQLLVRPCTKEEQTAGGIFIPERAQEGQIEGIVIVAGPGRYSEQGHFIPNDCCVGDRVLYGKFAGMEYKLHDQTVRLITSNEVMGIIR